MLKPTEVLDKDFLDTRCMLLEIAATLDRLDAAVQRDETAAVADDLRLQQIHQALQLLTEQETTPDRAERLLHLFSEKD